LNKSYRKMKKTIKNAILYFLALTFVFLGAPVLAEGPSEVEEERSVEMLLEKLEELVEIVEEMEERGELPSQKAKCDYYLTEYIRYGADNNPEEVKKLQTFLNEYEGEQIPVTGFYGEITMGAVNRLQKKYASEILTPWGITEPTGYVYITTQRFINNKKCDGVVLPTPELVVDTTVKTEDVEDEEVVTGDVEGDATEDVEDSEWIDENWEELRAEDEEEAEKKKDMLTWVVIILGSIGLGIVIYNIYTFKSRTT
jgi:hypothetical protein